MLLPIKIINLSNNPLPSYATKGAAGMDIRAFIEKEILIRPLERILIPTGLFIELPAGYEAQLRPRSGLAINFGITLPNAPATIDCDYRGEIKVALINLSAENYTVKNGDRIAQMIISSYTAVEWQLVDSIEKSDRDHGGFGSTGLQ
jgi:dUTP pyrophosphatase